MPSLPESLSGKRAGPASSSLAAEGSTMFRLTIASLLALATTATASAASPDPKTLTIPSEQLSLARELVRQLGSEQFTEREEAEAALAKMGRYARPALLEGVNTDPNQEVRARCSSLLPKANALDLQARLDVFLADVEGKFEHDLPGWNQFRATVCQDWKLFGYDIPTNRGLEKAARGVFAELVSTTINRQVVMAASGPREELGSLAMARRLELYYQKYPRTMMIGGRVVRSTTTSRDPTVEDLAALMFVETVVGSRAAPRTTSMSNLITSSGYVEAVQSTGDRGKVLRAIAAAWVESRRDPIEMYQIVNIAGNLGLSEEGCRLGIRLLTTPGAAGTYRGMAAGSVARLGNKDHIPLLDKALKDTTVAYTVRSNATVGRPINERETHDVQVRDMALAVAVIVSGQKLEDYGFVDNLRASGGISGNTYTYSRFYIPDDQRQAMHDKWKEWQVAETKKK
jgi:hypothetical protein